MFQETSFLAWDSIQKGLTAKQRVVMWAFLSQGKMTNAQMSEFLGWPINTVTPRVGELVKMGVIEAKGVIRGTTGRSAIVWGVK